MRTKMNGLSRGKKFRAGVTMIEVIVVVTIIAILAAISIPAMIGFIESGNQTNRMNIARTIYLAAQSELSKSSLENTLKSTLTETYYDPVTGEFRGKPGKNVADLLGVDFPAADYENRDSVYYVSKPRGFDPRNSTDAEQIAFYEILNTFIVDKSILNDPILMEYNVKTGVVMSVFYGDIAGQAEFRYSGSNDDISNIVGGRGMIETAGGYRHHKDRRQGYYGVETTGELPDIDLDGIINIYDGYSNPLYTSNATSKRNVLYAEILISGRTNIPYSLSVINSRDNKRVPDSVIPPIDTNNFNDYIGGRTDFDAAFSYRDREVIYRDYVNRPYVEQYGIDISGWYERYTWIIDYVHGDILDEKPNNRYWPTAWNAVDIDPQDLRAALSKDGGLPVRSLTIANSHYNSIMNSGILWLGRTNEVTSARHLNNVRYRPGENFRQTADIDMQLYYNEITNFDPIENFSGNYYAGGKAGDNSYRINDLRINDARVPQYRVGLFGNVLRGGNIRELSLYRPQITAVGGNVSALAGETTDADIRSIWIYDAVIEATGNGIIGAAAGEMTGGSARDILVRGANVSAAALGNVSAVIGRAENTEIYNITADTEYTSLGLIINAPVAETVGAAIGDMLGGTARNIKVHNAEVNADGGGAISAGIGKSEGGGIEDVSIYYPVITANGGGNVGAAVGFMDNSAALKILTENALVNVSGIGNISAGIGLMTGGTASDVTAFQGIVEAKNAANSNVGGLAGRLNGGTIELSKSWSNIEVTGGGANAGGLVGEITTGGILSESFNAGFYNAHESTNSAGGFGWITTNSGNVGGLAGTNSGTISNSFNNARVVVSDVSLTPENEGLLSYDPLSGAGSVTAGGIVGVNSGTLSGTYATNHVGTYESSYGGIAGSGAYDGTNFFIANGCDGDGSVSKEVLRDNPLGGVFAKGSRADNYDATEGLNTYEDYPYPVLVSNPFDNFIGWEDIKEMNIRLILNSIELLYYELYDDNSVGYWGDEEYDEEGDPVGPFNTLRNDKTVINDGYVLDFIIDDELTEGYIDLVIGASSGRLTIRDMDTAAPSSTWSNTMGGIENSIQSLVKYTYDPGDGTEVQTRIAVFFKNDFLEPLASGDLFIEFKVEAEDMADDYAKFFNPLFPKQIVDDIPNPLPDSYQIRSPRHFKNISNALDLDYNQALTLDFTDYSLTATFTGGTDVSGTATPLNRVESGSGGIVTGTFTGNYNGYEHNIQGVTKADKGLFENNGGTIESLVLANSTIINGNGIAGTNGGTIQNSAVTNVKISGGNDIGGIAGVNNGKIEKCEVTDTEINGTDDIGGIAGRNNSEITGCEVTDVTLSGSNRIGLAAGTNSGTISDVIVRDSEVTGDIIGGIVGLNGSGGEITLCDIDNITLTGGNNVGGVAGNNAGEISEITITAVSPTGVDNIGTVAGINSGRIETVTIDAINVTGTGSNIGGFVGENTGEITIDGMTFTAPTVTGKDNVGGFVGKNAESGVINAEGVSVTNAEVKGTNNIGGFVGEDKGEINIDDMVFTSPSVTGVDNVGGFAGAANDISGLTITGATVTGTGENAGGIAGKANKIEDSKVEDSTIDGKDNVGGIAGSVKDSIEDCQVTDDTTVKGGKNVGGIAGSVEDDGSIDNCQVAKSTVTGTGENTGGIAGLNNGEITNSMAGDPADINLKVDVKGTTNVGGIAGENKGTVGTSAVLYSTVNGTGNSTGGIAGLNSGTVEDVFFLSVADITAIPISADGGGIVGENSGTVTRSFYLAPAPGPGGEIVTDGVTAMELYPIVRSGSFTNVKDNYYLSGSSYSLNEGTTWTEKRYNSGTYDDGTQDRIMFPPSEQGKGTSTKFLYLEWLATAYGANELMNDGLWHQPGGRDPYPYPALKGSSSSDSKDWWTVPVRWPEVGSPIRPDQLDRDDWEKTFLTSERADAPNFVNGDFTDDLIIPPVPAPTHVTIPPGYTLPTNPSATQGGVDNILIPPYQHMSTQWFSIDMSAISGWYTRPVDPALFNPDTNGYYMPEHRPGPNQNGTGDFRAPYSYSNPSSVPRWRIIELQEPNTSNAFMRTNYLGQNRARNAVNATTNVRNSPFRYAELNAESPGTLYQVLPSTPGAQFYYSFYHATNGFNPSAGTETTVGMPDWMIAAQRPPDGGGDRLHFYLSRVDENEPTYVDSVNILENEAYAIERDSRMVMIRPCESPRSQPTHNGTTANVGNLNNTANMGNTAGLILNPIAWNTVRYGASTQGYPTGNTSGGPYDLSYHRGRSYVQPLGHTVTQNIPTGTVYLYDVWVGATTTTATNGGTRTGYGITFWSTANLTNTATGSNTNIPLGGMTQAQYESGTWTWLADARNNVIGYWGIEYGWKHFYGEYTVPAGQTQTEFAFQSRSGPTRVNVGNYLDGVSFKSGAFLSINKYIRDGAENIKFVKPGDELTVELHVQSWGEIAADGIVIIDQITPFSEYIEYVNGSATVSLGSIQSAGYNNGEVTITLNPSTRLTMGQSLIVTFKIKVLEELSSNSDISTLLYYFRNQAVVTYLQDKSDFKLDAYNFEVYRRRNGSAEDVQIFIDPIKLNKTITTGDGTLIDGPFDVSLTVSNNLEGEALRKSIDTTGLIDIMLPPGFQLASGGITRTINKGLPGESTQTLNPGTDYTQTTTSGGNRITIRNVGLGEKSGTHIYSIDYDYRIEYVGNGYGVSFTHYAADYRYLYTKLNDDGSVDEALDVMLSFPQAVVGISVKTQDDEFEVSGGTSVLNITRNSNFALRYADDNYDVTPVVRLYDSGGTLVTAQIDGDYFIDNDDYTAILRRATNRIEFTPKPGASGEFEFYYRITLTATKAGAEIESFELSSDTKKITVTVHASDTLVYYEEYADGYGLYAGTVSLPSALSGLDDAKAILGSGYGVLNTTTGGEDLGNGFYLHIKYEQDTTTAASNLNLVTVNDDEGSPIGQYHPNFAKAVYTKDTTSPLTPTPSTPETFSIRTPVQMMNISKLQGVGGSGTEDITFNQERDLDFDGITLTNSIVTGTFEGTFDGGGFEISNVTISAAGVDDIGLFSVNDGEIKNIELRPIVDILGRDRVGTIVGYNNNGTIDSCNVIGNPGGTGIDITGVGVSTGGIAGSNSGTISNCNIQDTSSTIKGATNVGGIAGSNSGSIENCGILNVKIEGNDYVGGIAGLNGGTIDNCAISNASIIGDNYVEKITTNEGSGGFDNCIEIGVVDVVYNSHSAPSPEPIDYEELYDILEYVRDELDENDYTTDSWANLMDAVDTANGVISDSYAGIADQDDINYAVTVVQDAIGNLVLDTGGGAVVVCPDCLEEPCVCVVLDYSGLEAAIAEAEALYPDLAAVAHASLTSLQDAVEDARDSIYSTQGDIDAAKDALDAVRLAIIAGLPVFLVRRKKFKFTKK
ncbi:MAG: prepilin-type N-terminal cleavage/methylation domain-containing protein [Oscillospiraceae bacterium]|nr:prepilin-type N-terminal cleavage/methylation domain-containing protein [Oscillospiraceae bacterium]